MGRWIENGTIRLTSAIIATSVLYDKRIGPYFGKRVVLSSQQPTAARPSVVVLYRICISRGIVRALPDDRGDGGGGGASNAARVGRRRSERKGFGSAK